jgi:DNA-binding GntR family transcriptional regulator
MANSQFSNQKSIRPQRMILSDETYETIRNMLLKHEISPGERIKIDGLARELDVSQTPVREALARLESEDLVLKVALKGYAATQLLNVKQLDDLFQFRAIIEPWAAGSAATNKSSADILALKAELLRGKTAGEMKIEDAYAAMSKHDARFHELIATMSGSEVFRDAFVRTHCHLHLFRLYQVLKSFMNENREEAQLVSEIFKLYYQPSGGFLAFKEHEAIADAIITGQSGLATALMLAHIESSRQRFGPTMSAIQNSKNPAPNL